MAGRKSFMFGRDAARRALLALLLLGGAGEALAGRQFYIDFESGNDAADGRSAQTAWKRAPGDPQATGNARAMVLAPGDRVLFRGGVRYRGTINVIKSGRADAPIVYDGSGWGARRAIIDGSRSLGQPVPCPSQAACLGSPHWQNLMMVPIPADTRWSDWLFVDDEALQLAQWPDIDNFWDYDKVSKMALVPKARLAELRAGFIAVPGVPMALMAGSPVLAQWTNINDIVPTSTFEITPEGIHFVNSRYTPYPDRDNRFVIYNAPAQVNAPGKFALSGKDGVAIFWPRAAGQQFAAVGTGTRRNAFEIRTVSNVRIRGFSFANFASPQYGGSTTNGEGVPIRAGLGPRHLVIEDNAFRSIVNMTRAGAIRVIRGGEIDIRRNQFEHLPWASAVYVSHNDGPARVMCNSIRNIGRNGVRILNSMHTQIESNRMEGINGIHGAGINLYLDNRYAMVRGNVITNSQFPLTMHGTTTPWFNTSEPVDLNIVNNVMISNDPTAAGISSWGRKLHNVTISDNFLGSERFSMRYSGGERNIVYAGNSLVGGIAKAASTQLIDGGGNLPMTISGNGRIAMEEAARTVPDQSACGTADSAKARLTSAMVMGR